MNAIDILIRMEEAARTLRRMPSPRGPGGHKSHWPSYVADSWLAYASEAANEDLDVKVKLRASPEEIDRMDECIPWLQLVNIDGGRAIWLRANGFSWRKCARVFGAADPRTGRKKVIEALETIARQLKRAA